MLPTSTSAGCSIAKAMARAMASGEIASFSFCLLIAALTSRSVIDESLKVVSIKPGKLPSRAISTLLPDAMPPSRSEERSLWPRTRPSLELS